VYPESPLYTKRKARYGSITAPPGFVISKKIEGGK
jgi:hypothetical protein